jgi:hypothetical protein
MMLVRTLGVSSLLALGAAPGCAEDDGREMQGWDDSAGSSSGGAPTGGSEPDEESGDGSGTGGGGQTDDGADDDDGGMKYDVDDGDGGGPGDEECPCAPNADLIFVLSDDAEIWAYDPRTNTFTQFGAFECGPSALTFSMGVSREAVAWVMYRPPAANADIFHVELNNANQCDDPGYSPGQSGFHLFGMAFAANGEGDPCDALYALSYDDVVQTEGPNAECSAWSIPPPCSSRRSVTSITMAAS